MNEKPTHCCGMGNIASRLEDIGRARVVLENLMGNEIFDNLSKHSSYWSPLGEEARENLDEVRRRLNNVHESICELYEILRPD